MSKMLFRALIALIFVCAATLSALAQADVSSATVKGAVTDPQGAAVPNAIVTIKNVDQGTVRTVQTNSDGEFQALLLRPGLYEINVTAQGFASQLLKDVQLTVGQT